MIVCPTVDIRDGSAWLQGPGSVRLRCACGSDDIFAIRPGSDDEASDLMGRRLVTLRGEATLAWCEACWRQSLR